MGRRSIARVYAINVAMDKHGPENYIRLLKICENVEQKVRGDTSARIVGLQSLESSEADGLFGLFEKFTSTDNWIDTNKHKPASTEQLDKLSIPKHLKPNGGYVPFVFFPKHHLMLIQMNGENFNFNPKSCHKWLSELFNNRLITDHFGPVASTVIPQDSALDYVLGLPRIKKLRIHITRPNPDTPDESEELEWEKRMERLNLDEYESTLNSKRVGGIQLDDEERAQARVAIKNGWVNTHGEDENGNVTDRDTRETPKLEPAKYDSNKDLIGRVLANLLTKFL